MNIQLNDERTLTNSVDVENGVPMLCAGNPELVVPVEPNVEKADNENASADESGRSNTEQHAFISALFDVRRRGLLQLIDKGEKFYRNSLDEVIEFIDQEQMEQICLTAFDTDQRDKLFPAFALAIHKKIEPGMQWKGAKKLAPNHYILDDVNKCVYAIWLSSKPVSLKTRANQKNGALEIVPVPRFAGQCVPGENENRLDLSSDEVRKALFASENWKKSPKLEQEDLEDLKAISDLRDAEVAQAFERVPGKLSKEATKILSRKKSHWKISKNQSFDAFQMAIKLADQGLRVVPVNSIDDDGDCTCQYSRKKNAKRYSEPFIAACGSPGKHPKGYQWEQRASNDFKWIIDEFTKQGTNQFGFTNLGVVTGPESDLIVIDLDGLEGINNFDDLADKNDGVPDTLTVKTGGGGEHIYFHYPKDVEIKNSVSEFGFSGSKIDIRGDNGFVVAPPSRHATGNQYEWAEGLGPDDVNIADAPQWIVDAALAATKSGSPSKKSKKTASKSNEASANKTGNSNADISGQAGSIVKNLLNKIGDGKGQSGFNSPINKVAIAYFHENGTDADFAPLKQLVLKQVNETEKKPERTNIDRYLSDEYLNETISDACEYVQENPAPDKPDWLPFPYRVDHGMIKYKRTTGDNPKEVSVCQEFDVVALSRENGEDAWALVISFKNADGKTVEFPIPWRDIYENPRKIRGTLVDKGFKIELAEAAQFDRLISKIKTQDRINSVSRPGWHGDAFVCPTGQVIGETGSEVISYKYPIRNVEPAGSIEGARKAMNAALNSCVSHWVLGVFGGGIACMLQLFEKDSCLIALTGETSKGKTTAQAIATSWWDHPSPQRGNLLVTLNSTDNAFEAVIERSTGVGFFGDEMKHQKGEGIQKLIFLLAGGEGKKRLKADSSVQDIRSWDNFGFLSGEVGLSNAIFEDKKTPANGIKARCLEIDVTNAPNVEQPIIDSIKACGENFGHIGPAFVAHIIDHEDTTKLKARLVELTDKFDEVIKGGETNASASALKRRAIGVMALAALVGEVMQSAGLIDVDFPVVEALSKIIDEQVDKDAMSPADEALKALQTSIVSSQHFHHLDKDGDAESSGYGDAYGWYDDDFTYIRTDKLEKLAGGSMTCRAIIKALGEADVLHRAPGKNVAFRKVGTMMVQHYKIDRSFSHHDGQDTG